MADFFKRLNPNFALVVFVGLLVFSVYLFFDEKRRREEEAITNACTALALEMSAAAENATLEQPKIVAKLCEDAGGTKPFLSALKDGWQQKEKTQ
jgi:hypothetical protein